MGGGNTDSYSRKLSQIVRDQTVCSLYLIPAPDAADKANIRITNTTSTSGVLTGKLLDTSGKEIFSGVDLLGGDKIQPGESRRLTPQILAALEGGPYRWKGKANLEISTSLSEIEVFGLVRSATGGPLTNMSVGGTGNGCD